MATMLALLSTLVVAALGRSHAEHTARFSACGAAIKLPA
jgi:hypothetical protein